jgi:hypothetical protein
VIERTRDELAHAQDVLLRVAWTIAALAIALGGAGLVASLRHQPGTASRAELTWAGDRAIEPGLVAAADDLRALAADLDRLGQVGRAALVAIVSRDTDQLSVLIDEGSALSLEILAANAQLAGALGRLPGTGPGEELRVRGELLARRDAIAEALVATRGVTVAWSQLESGALAATRIIGFLEAHDAAVLAATAEGRQQHYRVAIAHLDRAREQLAAATVIRDALRNTTDVATLDEWLTRNQAYDDALAGLYAALRTSTGRVTQAVRDAFAAEQAARERLPPNTNALVIIMNDIAQGRMNGAVVAIEEALGRMDAALNGLDGLDASASPTG